MEIDFDFWGITQSIAPIGTIDPRAIQVADSAKDWRGNTPWAIAIGQATPGLLIVVHYRHPSSFPGVPNS